MTTLNQAHNAVEEIMVTLAFNPRTMHTPVPASLPRQKEITQALVPTRSGFWRTLMRALAASAA
jgi:hypothetical protein